MLAPLSANVALRRVYGVLALSLGGLLIDTPVVSASERATTEVIVAGTMPVANAGPDQTVILNSLVQLDGSGSSSPLGNELNYSWTQVAGPVVGLSDAGSVAPTFTAPAVPTAVVFSLTVTDQDTGDSSLPDEVTVTVVDEPITGLTASNDSPALVGEGVEFQAQITGGTGVSFEWAFGDGNSGSGATATHVYAAPGDYTATVTASNTSGEVQETTDVVIINTPPVADAGPDQIVFVEEPVQLDGSGSFDPDGQEITYQWQQEGGLPVTLSDDTAVLPTFVAPDQPTVITFSLIVTDELGLSSTADEVVVTAIDRMIAGLTAENDGPTILTDPTQFTATVTAGTNIEFSWDFGDGNTGSGPSPSHTYSDAGSYTVSVIASNSTGEMTATTSVQVSGQPRVVQISTLTSWGLWILALLVAATAGTALRRSF
jgi:large repetitive protein